jgi:hypothetical protein
MIAVRVAGFPGYGLAGPVKVFFDKRIDRGYTFGCLSSYHGAGEIVHRTEDVPEVPVEFIALPALKSDLDRFQRLSPTDDKTVKTLIQERTGAILHDIIAQRLELRPYVRPFPAEHILKAWLKSDEGPDDA